MSDQPYIADVFATQLRARRISHRLDQYFLPWGPGYLLPTCWSGAKTTAHRHVGICENCGRKDRPPTTVSSVHFAYRERDLRPLMLILSGLQTTSFLGQLGNCPSLIDSMLVSVASGCANLRNVIVQRCAVSKISELAVPAREECEKAIIAAADRYFREELFAMIELPRISRSGISI